MSTSRPPHFLLHLAPALWLWQANARPCDFDGLLSFGLFLSNRFLLRVVPSQGLQKLVSDQMEFLFMDDLSHEIISPIPMHGFQAWENHRFVLRLGPQVKFYHGHLVYLLDGSSPTASVL